MSLSFGTALGRQSVSEDMKRKMESMEEELASTKHDLQTVTSLLQLISSRLSLSSKEVTWEVNILKSAKPKFQSEYFCYRDQLWYLTFSRSERGSFGIFLTLVHTPTTSFDVDATFTLSHDILPEYSKRRSQPFVFGPGLLNTRGLYNFADDAVVTKYARTPGKTIRFQVTLADNASASFSAGSTVTSTGGGVGGVGNGDHAKLFSSVPHGQGLREMARRGGGGASLLPPRSSQALHEVTPTSTASSLPSAPHTFATSSSSSIGSSTAYHSFEHEHSPPPASLTNPRHVNGRDSLDDDDDSMRDGLMSIDGASYVSTSHYSSQSRQSYSQSQSHGHMHGQEQERRSRYRFARRGDDDGSVSTLSSARSSAPFDPSHASHGHTHDRSRREGEGGRGTRGERGGGDSSFDDDGSSLSEGLPGRQPHYMRRGHAHQGSRSGSKVSSGSRGSRPPPMESEEGVWTRGAQVDAAPPLTQGQGRPRKSSSIDATNPKRSPRDKDRDGDQDFDENDGIKAAGGGGGVPRGAAKGGPGMGSSSRSGAKGVDWTKVRIRNKSARSEGNTETLRMGGKGEQVPEADNRSRK